MDETQNPPEKQGPNRAPRRRYMLTLDVQADRVDELHLAAKRAIAQLEIGAPEWVETMHGHHGEMAMHFDPDAPTGAAYARALEAWGKREQRSAGAAKAGTVKQGNLPRDATR